MPLLTAACLRRGAVLLFVSLLAAGCGFHLRGGGTVAAVAASYDVPAHPIAIAVGERLGARLDATAAGGVVDVRFSNLEEGRRARTLTAGIQAAEYELWASLRLEAARGGDVVLPARTLRVRRIYVRDPANLLGNEAQEDVIREDLRADLAEQALRILETVAAGG